jgi:predicted nuclease of predicted toxin-antitoxin system
MAGPAVRIKFFIDHCVPDSVGRALSEAEVIFLRERLAKDAPDPLVAAFSEMSGAVLVSFDHHFDALAPRAQVGRRRFAKLSRIGLKCTEPQAAFRIKTALSLIEHEWQLAQTRPDKRMIIEIITTAIRTVR